MFDPRKVPGVAVDGHLPPVDDAQLQPQALRARFVAPPVWELEIVSEPRITTRAPRPAAVLVPVLDRPQPTILLTQRTAHLSSHSGQIAFPGGKVDQEDANEVATALRETEEEIGLSPDYIEVLGSMPQYLTGTAYAVTPVVALVRDGFTLQPNPFEVADVFEVPLAFLMNPANHRLHSVEWEGRTRHWYSMLYPSEQGERFIWGATAGMLRNIYRFLVAR